MGLRNDILGVILAGGRSRRFGGGDKGLADLGGRPVLSHIVDAFEPQVGKLILNANGDLTRFSALGLDMLSDDEFAELGPLSGIFAALQFAERQDFGAIATVTSDVPFIPSDLVVRLGEARGESVAIALSQGRRHPTVAIWPLAAKPEVSAVLESGALGVDALTRKLDAVAVPFPLRDIGGAEVDPFFNLNTPEDFEIARGLVAKTRKT